MGKIQLFNESSLAVELRRSPRARRLSLRVSSVDGRVTLTLPQHVSEQEARRFVEEKSDWIKRAVANCESAVPVKVGAKVPIAGRLCPVFAGAGRSARFVEGRIEAPEGKEGPTVEALVKHMARDRLSVSVVRFSNALGKPSGRLTLRDTRSRWGSCTSEGNLMFSWRLALAPREVLDYVAAHEVAHLRHMDHSRAFWTLVEELYPGYERQRSWLRDNGAGLHRYKFR